MPNFINVPLKTSNGLSIYYQIREMIPLVYNLVCERVQRFKIIYFLMGLWDPQTMILMGPRALGMGPTTEICIRWNF